MSYELMLYQAQKWEREANARATRQREEWATLRRIDRLETKLRAARTRLSGTRLTQPS